MAFGRRRRVVRRRVGRRSFRSRKGARSSGRRSSRRTPRSRRVTRGFLGAAANARYRDTYINATTNIPMTDVNSTGGILQIDAVPRGNGVTEREGKAFLVKSVEMRGIIYSGTTTAYGTGRLHLVWDEQPNKSQCLVTDIFDTADARSLVKRENIARFRILGSYVYVCAGSGTTVITDAAAYVVDRVVATPRCVAACTSDDSSGSVLNRVSGCLYLVTQGDVAAGTGALKLALNVRINFEDIRS